MRRQLLTAAMTCTALACSESGEPSGLAGQWVSNQAPVNGGYISVSVVIAETGGVLTGSGLLTISGCFNSPYPVTLTGARAGTSVSFTLLPRDLNFSGTYAADSIAGTLTGLGCGGAAIAPPAMVLKR